VGFELCGLKSELWGALFIGVFRLNRTLSHKGLEEMKKRVESVLVTI
jgi:hypothetical protein